MSSFDIFNECKSFASGTFIDDKISFIPKSDGKLGNEVQFPLHGEDCKNNLLPFSSDAYFGKNDQAVLDYDYRFARVIYPDSFFCNFDPNNYNIIDQIHTQMGESNIKFVRDKLNIYGKDGHFKVHKDTPRSPDMIGTLVVCFPSAFTGGDLILHTKTPTIFDFDKLSATHFQWCAFYGDIDHEVKVVESGYRVTLTYLIVKTKQIREPNIHYINQVNKLLDNPAILPKGGFLGYGCKYMYSSVKDSVYKGEDDLIYSSFKSLGIEPQIEHISFWKEVDDWTEHECDCCKQMHIKEYVNRHFDDDIDICLECSRTEKGQKLIKKWDVGSVFYTAPSKNKYVDAEDVQDMMKQCGSRLVRDIYWINSPYNGQSKKAIESDILYGNDPTHHEEVYKRCAFFMYIPSYEKRKEGVYSNDENATYISDEINESDGECGVYSSADNSQNEEHNSNEDEDEEQDDLSDSKSKDKNE